MVYSGQPNTHSFTGANHLLSALSLCTVPTPVQTIITSFTHSHRGRRRRVLQAALFILQELLLLRLTLPEVNAKDHNTEADNTQGEKEVERGRIITGRTRVNDST